MIFLLEGAFTLVGVALVNTYGGQQYECFTARIIYD